MWLVIKRASARSFRVVLLVLELAIVGLHAWAAWDIHATEVKEPGFLLRESKLRAYPLATVESMSIALLTYGAVLVAVFLGRRLWFPRLGTALEAALLIAPTIGFLGGLFATPAWLQLWLGDSVACLLFWAPVNLAWAWLLLNPAATAALVVGFRAGRASTGQRQLP